MFVHEHCNYMTPTPSPNPPHTTSQIPDLLILSLCVYLSGADHQEIDNLCECSSWKGRDSASLSSHWPSVALSRKKKKKWNFSCSFWPLTGVIMLILFRFTSVNMFYMKLNVQTLYFQNILHWILTNKHNARCAICRTGIRTKFIKHPWYWIKHLVLRERLIFLLNCVQYYK